MFEIFWSPLLRVEHHCAKWFGGERCTAGLNLATCSAYSGNRFSHSDCITLTAWAYIFPTESVFPAHQRSYALTAHAFAGQAGRAHNLCAAVLVHATQRARDGIKLQLRPALGALPGRRNISHTSVARWRVAATSARRRHVIASQQATYDRTCGKSPPLQRLSSDCASSRIFFASSLILVLDSIIVRVFLCIVLASLQAWAPASTQLRQEGDVKDGFILLISHTAFYMEFYQKNSG